MVEINWTFQSIEDIQNIAEFIAKDSLKYAEIQVERFFNATEILIKFPKTERIVPEISNVNIRELIIGNYRIIYKILSYKRIDILTIHHSSRDISNNLFIDKI